MKTMTLVELFSHLEAVNPFLFPWQREIGPGDRCLFVAKDNAGTFFLYLQVEPSPPQVPRGYVYGSCYSDRSPDKTPGVAAVHPSEVFQVLSESQFRAAERTGFRSDARSVMAIINYTARRGDA